MKGFVLNRTVRAIIAIAAFALLACFPVSPSYADTLQNKNTETSPSSFSEASRTPLSLIGTMTPSIYLESGSEVKDYILSLQSKRTPSQEPSTASDKLLTADPALIATIGTQETSGHTICCPAYACAYADSLISGVAQDHRSYGCGCCVWTGWGGGNSSYRSLGSDKALLEEARENIARGYPTVIHVRASWGEHWITLVGYQNALQGADLTLDNFIALDPWDGAQITASSRYSLYGDHCEHISDKSVAS